MIQPLVSIIMGVYNNQNTIDKCIRSIVNQTFKNWEFIICNDGSTDSTIDILYKWEQKDKRIHILSNERNLKLSATLNRCLAVAKGKYIARMDADDESVSERLAKQVDFLEKNQSYDVVGTCAFVTDGDKITEVRYVHENPLIKNLLFNVPFMHPTIMMKKTVYDNLGGYTVSKRTIRAQDQDLWFRFFAKGYKGYNLQEPLLIYHESKEDLKKKTWKTTVANLETNFYGYRLLKVPIYYYPLALRPLLSYVVPQSMIKNYHFLEWAKGVKSK